MMRLLALLAGLVVTVFVAAANAGAGSVCVAAGTDAARTRPLADRSGSRMATQPDTHLLGPRDLPKELKGLSGTNRTVYGARMVRFSSLASAQPSTEPDDPWEFEEDDEPVETWQQLVTDQALDLGLFAAFAGLALTSFFRKSVGLKYVTLVAAVAYLGIYKSQLLSIVNVFGMMGGNLPLFKYNLGWYLFAVFSIVSTVLWGRLYCGRICAYGALTQLLDPIVPAKYRYDMPLRIERHASKIKYAILGGVVLYFLATRDMSIYRYVEPFWLFGGQASAALWIALGVMLVATVFVRNLYCRFLCPLGAALGLLSKVTIFGIKRWSECNSCKICEKTCQWGAIDGPKIIMTECVRCDDCERLYMDQQKCPHWIIIRRKSDVLARQSALPRA